MGTNHKESPTPEQLQQLEDIAKYLAKQFIADERINQLLEKAYGLSRNDPFYWERLGAIGERELGLSSTEFWWGRHISEIMALLELKVARDGGALFDPSPGHDNTAKTPEELHGAITSPVATSDRAMTSAVACRSDLPSSITPLPPTLASKRTREATVRVQELSERDTRVHGIVGENHFRSLANAEILTIKGMKNRLRTELKLDGGDAVKNCFDRIRLAKGYPLSRQIKNKRSTRP